MEDAAEKLDFNNLKKSKVIKATFNGVDHAMTPKSDHDALISAGQALLDWARRELMWQPIETAPRDGNGVLTYPHYRVTSWSDDLGGFSFWSDYYDDEVLYNPQPTHWAPLPPPLPNQLLPEPLEAFAEALKRVRGE